MLKQYSQSDMYAFHMPGHKRKMGDFINPFRIDITEISGFDDLHHADGILKSSMDFAARVYGTDRSFYLVNGSTCGILSAIAAVTDIGDKIIVARNCHKSVWNAVFHRNLRVEYVYPRNIDKMCISGGISPLDVENAIKNNLDSKAVVIVSPTYEGIVSDVEKIAKIVHSYGMVLIVDEAHGAHFSFNDIVADRRKIFKNMGVLPKSSLECGADIVIQSLHKTLPSLTQTAILHLKTNYNNIEEKLTRYLQIYQSSSPSYILMASIDWCIRWMNDEGRTKSVDYYDKLIQCREQIGRLDNIEILDETEVGENGVYKLDIGKIVIGEKDMFYSGVEIADTLRKRFCLELEMSTGAYAIAMTSIADSIVGLERLVLALEIIDREITEKKEAARKKRIIEYKNLEDNILLKKNSQKYMQDKEVIEYASLDIQRKGKQQDMLDKVFKSSRIVMDLYDTSLKEKIEVSINEILGENISKENLSGENAVSKKTKKYVAADMIYVYPPGIPIVMMGEVLTKEAAEYIKFVLDAGLEVYGIKYNRNQNEIYINTVVM